MDGGTLCRGDVADGGLEVLESACVLCREPELQTACLIRPGAEIR